MIRLQQENDETNETRLALLASRLTASTGVGPLCLPHSAFSIQHSALLASPYLLVSLSPLLPFSPSEFYRFATALNASSDASMVCSITLSVWARLTNIASYCEGAI